MLMTIILICLFIVILLLLVYLVLNYDTDPIDSGIALIACIILSTLSGMLVVIKCDLNKPTAMDVYRGNTTLEITYRDSIPVDSVVVFKNK